MEEKKVLINNKIKNEIKETNNKIDKIEKDILFGIEGRLDIIESFIKYFIHVDNRSQILLNEIKEIFPFKIIDNYLDYIKSIMSIKNVGKIKDISLDTLIIELMNNLNKVSKEQKSNWEESTKITQKWYTEYDTVKSCLRQNVKFMDSLASYFAKKGETDIALDIRIHLNHIKNIIDIGSSNTLRDWIDFSKLQYNTLIKDRENQCKDETCLKIEELLINIINHDEFDLNDSWSTHQ